jgi:GNAT superfamily N-acetyltransferase
MTFASEGFSISTDKSKLDLEMISNFLASAYWASNRSTDTILKSLEHSLCFGLYHFEEQIGMARVITDHATFAYLCDVFVLEDYRGQGLGKFLVQTVLEYPEFTTLRRFMLATKDAHGLYQQFGFDNLVYPDRWMEKFNQNA